MVLVSALAVVALLALLIAAIAVWMSWREARRRPHLTRAVEESEAKYQALVERLPAMVYLAELGEEGRWT